MILSIPAAQRKKEVTVVCTDTRVEIPAIAEMIEGTLDRMRKCLPYLSWLHSRLTSWRPGVYIALEISSPSDQPKGLRRGFVFMGS